MNPLGKPLYALLGLLSMGLGVAVSDTGFFGFLLAAPFIIAGFAFCLMSAMAGVDRELALPKRFVGGAVVVLGLLFLVFSFGAALDLAAPVGRNITQHHDASRQPMARAAWHPVKMRALTLADWGLWLAPPAIIVIGQQLRAKTAWRPMLARATYWAAYFPFVAASFILLAMFGWKSGN